MDIITFYIFTQEFTLLTMKLIPGSWFLVVWGLTLNCEVIRGKLIPLSSFLCFEGIEERRKGKALLYGAQAYILPSTRYEYFGKIWDLE